MLRTRIPRRLTALVAAYGLALQAMLAAVATVAPAFDPVICAAGRGAADPEHPPSPAHEPGCPLCPLACGGALALPSRDAAIAPPLGFGTTIAAPAAASPLAGIVYRAGLARAPPV